MVTQRALHAPLYRAKAKADMEWNGVNSNHPLNSAATGVYPQARDSDQAGGDR